MKCCRKLKRKHKVFLEDKGYNSRDFLIERDTTEKMVFVNRSSKEKIEFMK